MLQSSRFIRITLTKKLVLPAVLLVLAIFTGCSKVDTASSSNPSMATANDSISNRDNATDTQPNAPTNPNSTPETPSDTTVTPTMLTQTFDGDGELLGFTTNNAAALPETARVDGRYRAELTNNDNNVTLHFNGRQGRLDAKPVVFPFEFIARNIGIGTLEDSQTAPDPDGTPYIFAGVQVHVVDFNSINSSHVVVGHRGGTRFTIEGKNTLNGSSSVNDIGPNTAPEGRADIRIVGNEDKTLTVYWQLPNIAYETVDDDWSPYNNNGVLPGNAPAYEADVYVGIITYASGRTGIPFVGTCDAIQIK